MKLKKKIFTQIELDKFIFFKDKIKKIKSYKNEIAKKLNMIRMKIDVLSKNDDGRL